MFGEVLEQVPEQVSQQVSDMVTCCDANVIEMLSCRQATTLVQRACHADIET